MENLKASEAQRVIAESITTLGVEPVRIEQSVGRVLAEDIRANRDLPPFDVSAMDGFAVRTADIGSAPTTLSVIEDINAKNLDAAFILAPLAMKVARTGKRPVKIVHLGHRDGTTIIVRACSVRRSICLR